MKRNLVLAAFAMALGAVAFSGDRFWLQFLGKAMIACILAMSLDLLVGFTGLVSLAHAAFFGIAGYMLAGLTNGLDVVTPALTLPICVAAASVAALAIGWLSLRTSGVYFIMVTLAFTQMLFYLCNDWTRLGGSDGLYVSSRPIEGRAAAYVVIWIALVATYLLLSQLLRAPFGKTLVGIRSNEQRMRSLGYPTRPYKLVAFVIAGALAGVAGYLDAMLYGFVHPSQLGWRQSGLVLVTVLLGGKGTLYGPALGALLLAFVEHFGASVTEHWNAIVAVLVIVVVLAMARGIAGLLPGANSG